MRSLDRAHDRLDVIKHLVHGNGGRTAIAQFHHAEAVSHKDDVNARFVDHKGLGIRVGGDHRDLLAFLFHSRKILDCQFLNFSHILTPFQSW